VAVAVRAVSVGLEFAGDAKETLRVDWLSRHRVPEDFDRLWDLYWNELGPLAALPESIHDLEEVLVR
jgi:hypothetical protein